MDKYNYGGIQANYNGSAVEAVDIDSQVDIVSSWNIAEYLPKVTQISSYFTEKLLKIVCDTLHNFKGKNNVDVDKAERHVFRDLDGSHVNNGNAILDFIKHVCVVLAFNQNVQHDILRMRKNLLKSVRVKEFAPKAQFHDPCPSLTLSNVICSYCNDCRDLDLYRDPALFEQEWRCVVPQCIQPYDRERMENALLQIVGREKNFTICRIWFALDAGKLKLHI